MDKEEEQILEICARLSMSKNKNVNLHTIQKRYKKYKKGSPKKVIERLCAKGLMRKYRKENYNLTKEGRRISHELYDKSLQKLGMRILIVF